MFFISGPRGIAVYVNVPLGLLFFEVSHVSRDELGSFAVEQLAPSPLVAEHAASSVVYAPCRRRSVLKSDGNGGRAGWSGWDPLARVAAAEVIVHVALGVEHHGEAIGGDGVAGVLVEDEEGDGVETVELDALVAQVRVCDDMEFGHGGVGAV